MGHLQDFLPVWQYEEPSRSYENPKSRLLGGPSMNFFAICEQKRISTLFADTSYDAGDHEEVAALSPL